MSPIVSGEKQNANSKDRRESGNAEKKYNVLKYKYKPKWKVQNKKNETYFILVKPPQPSKFSLVNIIFFVDPPPLPFLYQFTYRNDAVAKKCNMFHFSYFAPPP